MTGTTMKADTTASGSGELPAARCSKSGRPGSPPSRTFTLRLVQRVRCEDFDVLPGQLIAVDPRAAVRMLADGSARLAYAGDGQRLRDALFRLRQAAEAAA